MAKRRSDVGQLSKEEYEALERRGGGGDENDNGDGDGSRKASAKILAGRRIVKVNRSKWGKKSGDGTAGATAMRAPSAMSTGALSASGGSSSGNTSSNPFASASLKAPSGGSSSLSFGGGGGGGSGSTGSSSNPFAKVSFSAPAIKTPTNAGTGLVFATSTKKPKAPSNSSFSFGSPGPAPVATSTSTSSPSASTTDINSMSEKAEKRPWDSSKQKDVRDLTMLTMAQKEMINNPTGDWSCWMKKYVDPQGIHYGKDDEDEDDEAGNAEGDDDEDEDILPPEQEDSGDEDDEHDASKPDKTSEKVPVPAPAPAPAVPKFSFGSASSTDNGATTTASPAAAAAKPLFSFGASSTSGAEAAPAAAPKPFTGFSFGATSTTSTTSPAPAPPTTKFSFGTSPAAAKPSVPAMAFPPKSNDDDQVEEAEKPTEVLKAKNENDEELFSCRAKYFVQYEDEDKKKAWKGHTAGALRLYRHKETKKCKLVIRDDKIGKVMLNLAIVPNMTFQKETIPKSNAGTIMFFATRDAEKGGELFRLKTKLQSLDELHKTLQDMAK